MVNQFFYSEAGADVLQIDLTGVTGVVKPLIDIYLGDELVVKDFSVNAQMSLRQIDTLLLNGDFSTLAGLKIVFKNDHGTERVDVVSVKLNNEKIDLQEGLLAKGGTTYEGQTRMYWNSEFSLDTEALGIQLPLPNQQETFPAEPLTQPEHVDTVAEPEMSTPTPPAHTVSIDLSGVNHDGASTVDIYINGVKVLADHAVSANTFKREIETLRIDSNEDSIDSIDVVFTNDNGPRRVSVHGISVDGEELELSDGAAYRSGDRMYEGQTTLYWNARFSIEVEHEEIPTLPDEGAGLPDRSALIAKWGGVDPDMYRGVSEETDPGLPNSGEGLGESVLVTVNPGTTVAQIREMIAAAPADQHLVLKFAAGEHVFTEQLTITRGNITVEGAGKDKTTIVADFDEGKIDSLIQIFGPDISSTSGTSNGTWAQYASDFIGTAAADFAVGDKQMTLTSTTGLKAGDFIMVRKAGTTSTTDDSDEFGTMAEVASIDGNTVTLKHKIAFGTDMLGAAEGLNNVKVHKIDLLENVTVRDFGIRYNISADEANNPYGISAEDMAKTTFNFYGDYAVGEGLGYGHNRALSVSGTHKAVVENIAMNDIGSNGFYFSTNLEMTGKSLSVDGTYNKGAGGNGYGLEYNKSYYGDFTDLEFHDLRHAITAHKLGGNGYNNFHVIETDANLDFHGGRDQANIYYVENIEITPYYVPKAVNGILIPDVNYSYGKVQFGLISYRRGDINGEENTVIWKNAKGNDAVKTGNAFLDEEGDRLAAFHSSNNDFLVANNLGAKLYGGFGSDILVSGNGNDFLSAGVGKTNARSDSDMFVFKSGGGQDLVADFGTDFDKIYVETNANGSNFHSGADVLAAAHQAGSDVVVNLGGDHSITITNTKLASLTADHFGTFDDMGFLFS